MRFYNFIVRTHSPSAESFYRSGSVQKASRKALLLFANLLDIRCDCTCASLKRQIRYMAKKELFSVPILKDLFPEWALSPQPGGADVSLSDKTISIIGNAV